MSTSDEQKIIKKITSLNKLYLNIVGFIIEETNEIHHEILHMDNNYFIEKPKLLDEFKRLFSDNTLHKLQNELNEFGDIVDVSKMCNHEWIDDSIDIDCEKSMCITYCKKCETSKKNK